MKAAAIKNFGKNHPGSTDRKPKKFLSCIYSFPVKDVARVLGTGGVFFKPSLLLPGASHRLSRG